MWGLLFSPGSAWRIAGGSSANDPLAPEPPVLTLTSGATDLLPNFSILLDTPPEEDDVLRFYDQAQGLLNSHTVTAGEAGGNPIALELPELTPGDYDFYVTHDRGGHVSVASNIESITLTAGSSSYFAAFYSARQQ
mgnify:FL=1